MCRILDFNNITGDLQLPNISCQNSTIKLISLLYNNITNFYPSNDTSSCFSESRILSDNKIFLGGNPICTNQSPQTRVLQLVCRFNASSPIIEGNHCQNLPSYRLSSLLCLCVFGWLKHWIFFIKNK